MVEKKNQLETQCSLTCVEENEKNNRLFRATARTPSMERNIEIPANIFGS